MLIKPFWDESHLLETFLWRKQRWEIPRVSWDHKFLGHKIWMNLIIGLLFPKMQRSVFRGAGLQACRLTCELEQLEILSSIHSKLHFSEKLVEGLHGQSLSHALTKETLIQQELTPKKKRENKNKRKNTVSVSVQRIYLGTFCQIPKIPRSTRMVAWLCWSLQANHESKDRGSLSLATSGVCFWCLEGWRLLLESSPHKLCFFPKKILRVFFPKTAKTVQDVQTDCWEPPIWCTWNDFSCHHSPLDSV